MAGSLGMIIACVRKPEQQIIPRTVNKVVTEAMGMITFAWARDIDKRVILRAIRNINTESVKVSSDA